MDMPDFLCTVRKPPPSIEKPPPTAAPPLWIGDVANTCHTGDIVLFSSKNLSSNFAKFFTISEWDHVGIVVRPTPTHAYLVEWGGGQRWWIDTANTSADAIRDAARKAGGHATLFRNGDRASDIFTPVAPPLMAVHKRLKDSFDPHGIFNPGRLYADF